MSLLPTRRCTQMIMGLSHTLRLSHETPQPFQELVPAPCLAGILGKGPAVKQLRGI
jgi:hypothetical protein